MEINGKIVMSLLEFLSNWALFRHLDVGNSNLDSERMVGITDGAKRRPYSEEIA
ncbi:MAG: hypothetical protein WBL63_23125 [Candidatus Acidiferrum sp.]